MKYFRSIRRVTISAAATLILLGAATAQADVQAGNYQSHTLASTTRHVVRTPAVESATQPEVSAETASVKAGNYQTHVLPQTTRRATPATPNAERAARDVAMSGHRR